MCFSNQLCAKCGRILYVNGFFSVENMYNLTASQWNSTCVCFIFSSTHERKTKTDVVVKHEKYYVKQNSFIEVCLFTLTCICTSKALNVTQSRN